MREQVRVVEYSVVSAEEREVMGRHIEGELEKGARVLGMFAVSFDTVDSALHATRVAVFYGDLGEGEPVGELVATATVESPVVEQIEQMTG